PVAVRGTLLLRPALCGPALRRPALGRPARAARVSRRAGLATHHRAHLPTVEPLGRAVGPSVADHPTFTSALYRCCCDPLCARYSRSAGRPRWMRLRTVASWTPRVAPISS